MDSAEVGLLRVSPILTSYDINATEAFYTERLGFQTMTKYLDFGYLIVMRDQVSLHFALAQGGDPSTTSSECYIYVVGVDALYAQAVDADAVHPHGKLQDKPWGMREFALLDRDGNLLRISEDIS